MSGLVVAFVLLALFAALGFGFGSAKRTPNYRREQDQRRQFLVVQPAVALLVDHSPKSEQLSDQTVQGDRVGEDSPEPAEAAQTEMCLGEDAAESEHWDDGREGSCGELRVHAPQYAADGVTGADALREALERRDGEATE